jgi:3-phosphoshikimate 1-carboxyvinyltransferase
VPHGRPARGRLRVPPSKSLTHRYYNLALLTGRPLVIERPLDAEDTRLFLAALAATGRTVETAGERVTLGPDPAPPSAAGAPGAAAGEEVAIDCGNAGTLLRFLIASLAARPGRWRLDGVARLRQRPVAPLVEALRRLGAKIEALDREGYVPLRIEGGRLPGGRVRLDAGESSQYLSALLMASLAAEGPVEIEVEALTSSPYVELTRGAIAELGGRVDEVAPGRFRVEPGFASPPPRVTVEGDFSAACYPAAAAALTGGEVELEGLTAGSGQGDRGFFDLLAEMGAAVEWGVGSVRVAGRAGGGLRAVDRDLSAMPDQVPTLAALGPFAAGTTRVTGVPHLRIKESDRLAAMATELTRLGARADERPDGLTVPGVWAAAAPPATPVTVDSHGDHRIAMSLALVGLRRPGVAVAQPEVVAKSYPAFWDDLAALVGR